MSIATEPEIQADGPPRTLTFSHVSVPCRDIAEGKLFYTKVLGATVRVDTPEFRRAPGLRYRDRHRLGRHDLCRA